MATKVAVERVTARIFCHGSRGGNPVSVFSTKAPLSLATQERLAKMCEWESVMVSPSDETSIMAFYMPSGEQVSFCAHAALGGAFTNSNGNDTISLQSQMTPDNTQKMQVSKECDGSKGIARLDMTATYEESPVSHLPSLARLLRGHLGLGSEHLINRGKQYPTFVNASIARPKTLVYVNSIDILNHAKQPKVSEDLKQRNSFAAACGAIDDSTGIYVYAKRRDEEDAWECRQFPRASGYPEDPATGIAAGALACSLYRNGVYSTHYKCYQGTAMQRPSLVEVLDLQIRGSKACFTLQGRVEIDEQDTIEVED